MRKLIIVLAFALFCFAAKAQIQVINLRTEHLTNPVGIDLQKPTFSWMLSSMTRNVMQKAYEIRVDQNASMKGTMIWESGKVVSDQSLNVPYAGTALRSGNKYFWQVRVWDNLGKPSKWSEVAYWQMALLHASDWKAKWIEPGYVEDTVNRVSPLLRKSFKLNKEIKSATAYITSHGMYEANINGNRVGNDPGAADRRPDRGPRKKEDQKRHDKHPQDQKDQVADLEAAPVFADAVQQELHRGPPDAARFSTVEQVDHHRDADSRESRQEPGCKEGHRLRPIRRRRER